MTSGRYTRRVMWLKRGGTAVTLGMLAAAFGAERYRKACGRRTARRARPRLTILYPAGAGLTFNADYYRDHHLTTIMKLYGKTIQRMELRRVNAPPPPPAGAKPPAGPRYAAAINIWVTDLDAFNANNQKHGKTLTDDVPNFTNSQPVIQFDRIQGEMGAPRSAPKIGDTCLTILYPNSEGVRWDVDYYRTGHMPLIMRLYGEKAIKRFRAAQGRKRHGSRQQGGVRRLREYLHRRPGRVRRGGQAAHEDSRGRRAPFFERDADRLPDGHALRSARRTS